MAEKFHIDYDYRTEPVQYKSTVLFQLGRLYCTASHIIDEHAHENCYELTIITDGEGIVNTNRKPTRVKKGDIYMSYPGDFHEIISSDDKPLKYDYFAFDTKNKAIKKEIKKIVSERYSYNQRKFRDEQVNLSVSKAIAEMGLNKKYSYEILCLLFDEILFYLIRDLHIEAENTDSKRSIPPNELCFQIMHYIDTNIYSIKSLSELSEVFSYNYSYLSDFFKKNTGNTIVNYYRVRRLDTARLLINEGRFKIKQISEMLNYSSVYAFSKAFKNEYGVSPKIFNASQNGKIKE